MKLINLQEKYLSEIGDVVVGSKELHEVSCKGE